MIQLHNFFCIKWVWNMVRMKIFVKNFKVIFWIYGGDGEWDHENRHCRSQQLDVLLSLDTWAIWVHNCNNATLTRSMPVARLIGSFKLTESSPFHTFHRGDQLNQNFMNFPVCCVEQIWKCNANCIVLPNGWNCPVLTTYGIKVGCVPHRVPTGKSGTPGDVYYWTEYCSRAGSRNVVITYCIGQSPSWEANRFPPSQKIPHILWNPNISYPFKSASHLSLSWASSI